jgi:hypothetical protein
MLFTPLRHISTLLLFFTGILLAAEAPAPPATKDAFAQGLSEYLSGNYGVAAEKFQAAALDRPSAGVYHNLGNAEWKLNNTGRAILAWEQCLWLDPWDRRAKTNLRLARSAAQIESPDLTWFELCSTWLPASAWAWLASLSFWSALVLLLLPGLLGWRKFEWQQGLATGCFTVFILTLPALAGLQTRSRSGLLLSKPTGLRLTPTDHAQIITSMAAGEWARLERRRGDYLYLRMNNGSSGWVKQFEFGALVP